MECSVCVEYRVKRCICTEKQENVYQDDHDNEKQRRTALNLTNSRSKFRVVVHNKLVIFTRMTTRRGGG